MVADTSTLMATADVWRGFCRRRFLLMLANLLLTFLITALIKSCRLQPPILISFLVAYVVGNKRARLDLARQIKTAVPTAAKSHPLKSTGRKPKQLVVTPCRWFLPRSRQLAALVELGSNHRSSKKVFGKERQNT